MKRISLPSAIPSIVVLTVHNSSSLFESNTSRLINDKLKSRYHTIVTKLLYLAKRTRPELLTAVSALCSPVNDPSDKDLDYAY